MFNLYFFVDYTPEDQEPDPCTIAFDISGAVSIYGEAYVKEGSFETMEAAEERMNNIGSRWILYPNACIVEMTGEEPDKVVAIYMADGRNYILKS